MRSRPVLTPVLALVFLATSAAARPKSPDSAPTLPPGFREVPIPHYLLYTDMGDEEIRGAKVRLDRLVAEYDKRTREFGEARTDKQMPFYLFSKKEDYYAAGGMRGSAGVFQGDRMMACVGDKADSRAWSTIQHEAFHQYADMKLKHLPIWVNEGIAEYFGHGIFTGDGFVSGGIPQWRLDRVRKHIAANEFLSVSAMLRYTHEQWNERIQSVNYDQAWAYVQFLAHGSGRQGQKALEQYIRELGRGADPIQTFRTCIGEPDQVERRFTQWVADLPDNPTLSLYGEAGVATVTSFVARAAACRQVIRSTDQLASLVQGGQLLCSDEDWIPVQLLEELLPQADQLGSWSIAPGSRNESPAVVLRMRDGLVIRGLFRLNRGRVADVWVESQQPRTAPSRRSR